MPNKPTSPPSHWIMPREGEPRFVSDELPADYVELERHVALLFAEWAAGFGVPVVELPRPTGDYPDAHFQINGYSVGIELVEVVDSAHRRDVARGRANGGGYEVDPMNFANAVAKKIAKGYKPEGYDEFWLLCWDSYGYLSNSDPRPGRDLLSGSDHPFDAVFGCWLIGGGRTIIGEVWPSDVPSGVFSSEFVRTARSPFSMEITQIPNE
jgi:hypothetical protein